MLTLEKSGSARGVAVVMDADIASAVNDLNHLRIRTSAMRSDDRDEFSFLVGAIPGALGTLVRQMGSRGWLRVPQRIELGYVDGMSPEEAEAVELRLKLVCDFNSGGVELARVHTVRVMGSEVYNKSGYNFPAEPEDWLRTERVDRQLYAAILNKSGR